jgi:uncharacterized protein with GYD domain
MYIPFMARDRNAALMSMNNQFMYNSFNWQFGPSSREGNMAKYLFQITYSESGLQDVLKQGGHRQREVIERAIRSLDGWLEVIYFSFGESDLFVVTELPDNASAAAFSMIASSAGAYRVKTVVLISPEEIDKAAQKTTSYAPPGG